MLCASCVEIKERQGIHPTPWQCSKCRACHANATGRAAETKGRQGVHPTPWQCTKCSTQKPPAERRRPRDARAYIRPLQSTKGRTCHANATGRAAETKGRQGVHLTPCSAPSAAPATQTPPAERRRPREARACIRPLAEHRVPRLPRSVSDCMCECVYVCACVMYV